MIDFVVSRDIEKEMLHRYAMPLLTKADGLQRKWMQLLREEVTLFFPPQRTFINLKSTIETLENGVKYVQS